MAYLGHEHLFSFDNFINQEDMSTLVKFNLEEYRWNPENSWVAPMTQHNNGAVNLFGRYAEEQQRIRGAWPDTAVHPLMVEYGKKIMATASISFGRTLVHRLEPYMKCFTAGMDHKPHADAEAINNGEIDFMPNYSPDSFNTPVLIEVAANLYLTDDFDGGELYFPNLGVTIKPKAGQLILFPGGHEYSHGVKEVISGKRIVLFSPLTSPQRMMLHVHAYNLWHELQEIKNGKK
jgi:predicted 2-oxoglutarate/Fe(II)-dependent dioxygenase YbiX